MLIRHAQWPFEYNVYVQTADYDLRIVSDRKMRSPFNKTIYFAIMRLFTPTTVQGVVVYSRLTTRMHLLEV